MASLGLPTVYSVPAVTVRITVSSWSMLAPVGVIVTVALLAPSGIVTVPLVRQEHGAPLSV